MFDQCPVVHDCIVKSETSGKIVGFKAVSFQNPGSDVAAQTALADNIDRLPLGDVGDTTSFLISSAPETKFIIRLASVNGEFEFDTDSVKEEIGDVPITEYEILQWIKDYVNENVQIIFGGVLNEIIS